MNSTPYVGIIGAQTATHVANAHWQRPAHSARQLMVAARLNIVRDGCARTDNDLLPYTDISAAAAIFDRFPEHINLFYLSVPDQLMALCLDQVMVEIYQRALNNWDGFEIATSWPSIAMLESYRRQTGMQSTIVVRTPVNIGNRYPSVQELVDRIHAYAETVNTIVLDFGQPGNDFPDIEHAATLLRALYADNANIGIGFAGGIGHDNAERLRPLLTEFPKLSFEADVCLHGFDHCLDDKRTIEFLRTSFSL